MRAGNRPEHGDEDEQHRAGRERVAEQGDGVVPARQMLGHDARADDGGEQEEGADALRRQPPRQRRRVSQESASRRTSADVAQPLLQAQLVDALQRQREEQRIRRWSAKKALRNARALRLALDRRRILDAPMGGHRLAGPDRAGLARRIVADGEDEIELGRAGAANSSQLFER